MIDDSMYSFAYDAILGGFLASILLGVVGVLVSANKAHNLVGAISHGAYSGVGISVYFALPLFACVFGVVGVGAFVLSLLAYKKQEHINIFSSMFWAGGMGVGVLLVEQSSNVVYGNLMSFLFGSILLVDSADIITLSIVCVVVVAIVWFFYDSILCVCLSKEYAKTKQINAQFIYTLVIMLSSIAIVVSIKLIGLILILALISIPPFMASCKCNSLWVNMVVSGILCFVFIACGLGLSFYYDINSSVCIILFALFVLCVFMGYAYFKKPYTKSKIA